MLVFATGPLPAYADVSRDLIRAIIKNDIPAVFRLVQAGANLNFRSPTGNTPLHEAAALGHGDIAQILVDGGASVTMKNNAGFTPLDWARRRGYPQIAELIASASGRKGPSRLDQERQRVAAEQGGAQVALAPTPPPEPEVDDFLSRADRRELQADLQALGFYTGAIDGLLGPQSRRAVSAWQSRNKLDPTGRVDPKQFADLRIEAAAARAAAPKPPAPEPQAPEAPPSLLASIGEAEIRSLEEDLAVLGFQPGEVDGKADEALETAISEWRGKQGDEEGDFDIAAYASLKRLAGEKREEIARENARAEAKKALQASLAAAAATQAPMVAEDDEAAKARALAQIEGERRVALVIGNGAYQHMAPLANPINDADDMSAVLRALSFDVINVTDGDLKGMRLGLRRFATEARDADIAVFFYAGHGVQANGENFLMPVAAQVESELDFEFEGMSLNQVLELMNRSNAKLKLALVDACRDNPVPRSFTRSAASRGLARVETGAVGTYIAFATSPGGVAADGQGRNSPFTAALLKHMPEPDVEVGEMFRKVRQSVLAETGGTQLPWSHDSVVGSFYFAGQY